jgi:hypothetical protein
MIGRGWLLTAIALVGGFALGLLLASGRGDAVSSDPVSVSPAPGSISAAAATQISLRGLARERLGDVEVSGSKTGAHSGRLAAHSDGDGASFLPDEPFEPGEEVTVRTSLTVLGARDGDYRFTVARPAAKPKPREENRPGGEVQRFRSRPDIEPPAITITARSGEAAPGYVFLAPKRGNGLDGPMIVDSRGKLVWAKEVAEPLQAANFQPQRYEGRPVLTWWEGGTNTGVGYGEGVVLDQSYREIARVRAGNGYRAGLHELELTERGTALLIVYAFDRADLSGVGGPEDGAIVDGVVQEVEVDSGLVRFEWHSRDHIDLEESKWEVPDEPGRAYDFVHLNSVDVDDDDGDLLVSARHSWAVYKVDRETGSVRWRLGGTDSDFPLEGEARFAFQHDARRRGDGRLMLFDNAAGPPQTRKRSRALVLDLDVAGRTATAVRQYEHPDDLLSDSQGNAQELGNGNVFVGWGSEPAFSEFSADGRLLFDGRLAKGNDNYRAFRSPWTGRPTTRPRAAVATLTGDRRRVVASWNGATEVARWEVLAGPHPERLRRVGSAAERGFETPMTIRSGPRVVAVRALDASGGRLGVSEPVELP